MDIYFAKLLDIINQETKLFKEISLMGDLKKDIIMKNDIDELEKITIKEQAFTKAIIELEKKREEAIDDFCKSRNKNFINNLSELINIFDETEKKQFKMIRDEYINSINKTKRVNDLNQALIKQSLDYVNLNINLANSMNTQDIGYNLNLEDKEVKIRKNLFDRKV